MASYELGMDYYSRIITPSFGVESSVVELTLKSALYVYESHYGCEYRRANSNID
jgi:hypothetical protein